MKATELMLGDWVVPVEGYYKYAGMRVNRLDLNRTLCINTEYGDVEIDPIPLSEELIRANGWYISGDCMGNDFEHKGVRFLIRQYGDAYNTYGLWRDGGYGHENVITSVRYVHELQHAFRMLGRADLAESFDIHGKDFIKDFSYNDFDWDE